MKLETYQDSQGLWRWRLRARNGRIVAESGEGYSKRGNLKRALLNLEQDTLSDEGETSMVSRRISEHLDSWNS